MEKDFLFEDFKDSEKVQSVNPNLIYGGAGGGVTYEETSKEDTVSNGKKDDCEEDMPDDDPVL